MKRSAFNLWKSLRQGERSDAIRGIPLFIAHVLNDRKTFPERQFCALDVYLRQARWEGLIEAEDERFAALEQAKAVSEDRAKPKQTQLTLVMPTPKSASVDERQAQLREANSRLINQNRDLIKPVIDECEGLAKNRAAIVVQRRWDEFRRKMPYLPSSWKEVKFG